MSSHNSFTDKYKPKSVDDLVLTKRIRLTVDRILKTGKLQNLLLYGPYGTGKTSLANVLIDQLDVKRMYPESRSKSDIEKLYKIYDKTTVFGKKYVAFIDEADQLRNDAQKFMLQPMEGTGTSIKASILIANDLSKIDDGIISRTKLLDFYCPEGEKIELIKQIKKRIIQILESEGVIYKVPDVDQYIEKFCANSMDIRNVINEIEGNVSADNVLVL